MPRPQIEVVGIGQYNPDTCFNKLMGERPFTDPWVPTGMKIGVSKVPCGVSISPTLARPREHLWRTLNSNHFAFYYTCKILVLKARILNNQHGVPVTVKPVSLFKCPFIGLLDEALPGKSGYKEEQRRPG